MTAARITAAIDRECMEDYLKHANDLWVQLAQSIEKPERRLIVYDKMLQPYKYYKDEWLKREAGNQQLVDVMKPPATADPLMPYEVPLSAPREDRASPAYLKLKFKALAKAQGRLDSEEFYGMLDLCKRRAKGKTVEPVHGKEKLIQNVIEAGLLGRMELESFLEGKVRKG